VGTASPGFPNTFPDTRRGSHHSYLFRILYLACYSIGLSENGRQKLLVNHKKCQPSLAGVWVDHEGSVLLGNAFSGHRRP